MGKWLGKALLFVLAVFVAAPGLSQAEEARSFSDVSGTFWASNEINSMAQLGFVGGYEDNTFRPNNPVSREEFAALITRAFYLELSGDKSQTFVDVAPDRWSYNAIEAAKEFLTGYYPPNGKAFFDPTAKATREDVAVALVKTLGYEPDDLKDEYILDWFYDGDDISPNVRTYVALAVENKLMSGYQDGTFQPNKAVTRAETATLLYRVIKGAAADGPTELVLNVSAPETTATPTFYVTGDVTKGATVYINNEEVEVVQGQFRVGFELEEEGTFTYTVSARLPGGKTESVKKSITFEKGAPTLEVKGVPESTDKGTITVSWTVKDENDYYTTVYVNGVEQYSSSTVIELEEGLNEIVVTAENSSGKSTEVVKQVTFQSGGPVLNVMNVPATTDKDRITVSWTVQDKNDSRPIVYLNGEQQYGTSATVSLKEGANTLTFKAVNKLNKTTEVVRTVILSGGAPTLSVDPLPETTNKTSITVAWRVQDQNDSSPKVYVNGELMFGSSTTLALKEGANVITVRAVNKLGKVAEVTKTVTFGSDGPKLTVTPPPLTTSKETVSLAWSVSDTNDYSPKVYVNDEQAYGSSTTIALVPGPNTITVRAVNSFGKSVQESYTVTFEPQGPRLSLGYAPETTTSETITLTWSISDENDYSPKVYLNDQLMYSSSMNVKLTPGANTFKIVASNKFGKTTVIDYTVTYTPPAS